VTNSGSNTVSVIDTASNTVTGTVPVGTWPTGVAINPEGTKVYVVNEGYLDKENDGTVSVIDTVNDIVIATVNLENSPSGVAVTPDGKKIYVASRAITHEHETPPDHNNNAIYHMREIIIVGVVIVIIGIGMFFVFRRK
jgi:YVTN family beta-propeller protein